MKLETARTVHSVPNLAEPLSPECVTVKCAAGEFRLDRVVLEGGRREGVEILLVDTGLVRAAILPTRGMSLWRAHIAGMELGWQSPVAGPIHPQWVALEEAGGLGWLDGFDELLVRCGLRSFGAPDFDSTSGRLTHPLHGRIGNLPAENVTIELDDQRGLLHVRGEVRETRFLQYDLRLTARYTFALDTHSLAISDTVKNASDTPTTLQLLYHINVGQPLLGQGSRLHLAARRIVASNDHAAKDLESWQEYSGPTPGYREQVYFSAAAPGQDGWATALLTAPDNQRAFAVHYQANTLPFFTQWKNTVGANDGYVTGMEPGTSFPNPRSFEAKQNRLVTLDSQESRDFNLRLEGIPSGRRVSQIAEQLAGIRTNQSELAPFDADWCVPKE